MSPLAEAFYQIIIEEESTSTIENIRNLALAKIAGGSAKEIINSSVNGKSFSFNISKPADVIFSETSQAIATYRGLRHTATSPDFSGI